MQKSWIVEARPTLSTDFSVISRCEIYLPAKIVRTMATRLATDGQEPGAELSELIETREKAPWNRANDNSADNVLRPILQLFQGKADADKPPCSVPDHYRDPRIVVPTQLQILRRHNSRVFSPSAARNNKLFHAGVSFVGEQHTIRPSSMLRARCGCDKVFGGGNLL
jgi:hypothetical protein